MFQVSHAREEYLADSHPLHRGERIAARDNQGSKRATHVIGGLGPTAHSLSYSRESFWSKIVNK